MITTSQYNRRSVAEWKGLKVRSLHPLRTSMAEMPAGTIYTITGKFSGFDLTAEPCAHCGVAMKVSRVAPEKLEIVE